MKESERELFKHREKNQPDFLWQAITAELNNNDQGASLMFSEGKKNLILSKEGKQRSRELFIETFRQANGDLEIVGQSIKQIREERDKLKTTDEPKAKKVTALLRSLSARHQYQVVKEYVKRNGGDSSGSIINLHKKAKEIKLKKEKRKTMVDRALLAVSSFCLLAGLSLGASTEGYVDFWKIKQSLKSLVPGLIHQLKDAFGPKEVRAEKTQSIDRISRPVSITVFPEFPVSEVSEQKIIASEQLAEEAVRVTEKLGPTPTISQRELESIVTPEAPALPKAGIIFEAKKEEPEEIQSPVRFEKAGKNNRLVITNVTKAYDGNDDQTLEAELKEILPTDLVKDENNHLAFPNPKTNPDLRDKAVCFTFPDGNSLVGIENVDHLKNRAVFKNWLRASLERIVNDFDQGINSPCSITFKGKPYLLIWAGKVKNNTSPADILAKFSEHQGKLLVIIGCSDPQNNDPYNSKLDRNAIIAVEARVIGTINGHQIIVPYWSLN